MTEYSIYSIVCKDPLVLDIYVGSTNNFKLRGQQHKSTCNNINDKNYNIKLYTFIRDNGGFDNWDMVLIKTYICVDKSAVYQFERLHYEELNSSLNSCHPSLTKKEYNVLYRDNNADKIRVKHKEYNILNADKIKAQSLEYRTLNADKIKEKRIIYRDNNHDIIKVREADFYKENADKIKVKHKEYNILNADKIKAKHKKYNIINADKIKAHKAEYNILNADKIKAHKNQVKTCDCGKTYQHVNYARHCRTQYHLSNINT
tara:strand:+ start:43 stop:822 length:780 start_codon:yes stop_codon:yes gene_type:complete